MKAELLSFGESLLSFSALTMVATLLGMVAVLLASRYAKSIYIAAFAVGAFFWYYSDTIGDSGYLDVNAGISGGNIHLTLVLLFAIGLISFPLIQRRFTSGTSPMLAGLGVPLLIAFALGIHGLGEGLDFGATAASTPATSILAAFGGTWPGVAYAIHKSLEFTMVGASYFLYSGGRKSRTAGRVQDLLTLVVAFSLPSVLGSGMGFSIPLPTDYIFAFATGSGIYAVLRLAGPAFGAEESSRMESLKMMSATLLGFIALYAAALLHS